MALRVLWGYSGGEYDGDIAKLYTLCGCIYYSRDTCRIVDPEFIRELWYGSSWFNPDEHFLVFIGDQLVGYGWAWFDKFMERVNICVDPGLEYSVKVMIMNRVFHEIWVKSVRDANTPYISINGGREYGELYYLLRNIREPLLIKYTTTLMRLDPIRYEETRREYSSHYRRYHVKGVDGVRNARDIVEIYNDAFSIYPWFIEWRVKDAVKWYKRHEFEVFMIYAENGEPIGFCDISIRRNYYGKRIGYIQTLAVKRKYQGRGYGTILLLKTIEELRRRGVNDIYLDAIHNIQRYYYRRGFEPIHRYVRLIYEIS